MFSFSSGRMIYLPAVYYWMKDQKIILHKFLHFKISITFAFPKNEVVRLLGIKFFTGLTFKQYASVAQLARAADL